MSFKVTAWVLEHSESTLASRLVLIALAEYAHDDGGKAFPSIATIARKARVGESTVYTCLAELERDGRITKTGKTKYGTSVWKVQMKNSPEMQETPLDSRGAPNREGSRSERLTLSNQEGDPLDSGPDPVTNQSSNHHKSATRVRAMNQATGRERILRFDGNPVNPALWDRTQAILVEFNAQAGKKLRPVTSGAKLSEAATRIYGRVVAYPDLTVDEHADIIRRTLASRWWGKDAPSIGVVYGPKVFEDNITRSANGSAGLSSDDLERAAEQARLRGM